ncbi:hypothetical protein [Streptomyces sp. Amel2xC10]|uniref:hypothetical protein n=1 Tax=Streptomyces sp. Amel2xC10 TaxID=1305826 RepID=UPI0015C45A3D|nr:hypothetical protein [Streptomyces sp. Amel2xC10]
MSTTAVGRKVDALLWLAGGKSNRVAAEAAGVAPSTVAGWKRDPVFAAELAAVKALYEERPQDGRALVARLEEAERRLAVRAAGPVRVVVPGGVSLRRVERLVSRAGVRALRSAGEVGS